MLFQGGEKQKAFSSFKQSDSLGGKQPKCPLLCNRKPSQVISI
jgi:hypothetical protein